MTQGANVSYWLRADIMLKNKSDLSTITLSVTNRNIISTSNTSYFPLIWDISELGMEMGLYLPQPISGSISLIDSFDSFGVERKVSDLLERYIIQDQPIEIFYAANKVDELDPASWTSIFKGLGQTWQRTTSGKLQLVEIAIEQRPFKKKYIGETVKTSVSGFASAPTGSIGAVIPLIINGAEVKPVLIGGTDTAPVFAFGINFEDKFLCGDPNSYYTQDFNGEWKNFIPSGASYVAGQPWGPVTTPDGFNPIWEESYTLPVPSSPGIITGGRLRHDGTQVGTFSSGIISIEVYQNSANSTALEPGQLIAKATMKRSDYSYNGGSPFDLRFTFDRPFLWHTNLSNLCLSVYETLDVGQTAANYYAGNVALGTYFVRKQENDFAWVRQSSVTAGLFVEFYGIDITIPAISSTYQDSEGYRASLLNVSQKASGTSQTDIDLRFIPLIIAGDGITDDASGTITGTPGTVLNQPNWIVKLLSYNWNPDTSNWEADTNWDHTIYSSTYAATIEDPARGIYWRDLTGITQGLVGLEDLLTTLCYNSATRIGVNNAGKLGLWSWGSAITASKTFTQENARLRRIFLEDDTYIVNHAIILYGAILRALNPDSIVYREEIYPFTATVDWYKGFSVLATELIGNSKNLYGERFLQENRFNYVANTQSAEFLARFFLARFNFPMTHVEIEVPFPTNDTLKLLDVVNLQFPELPNYYGSSPNAMLPNVSGLPIDLAQGYTYTRSAFVRGIIEARKINFSQQDKDPSLHFRVRLLTNNPKDPT